MKKELDLKHQIYVIAPMINHENSDAENVTDLEEKMNKAFGKLFTIKSVHGKLSSEEKREFGMLLNSLKQELTSTIDAKIKYYEEEALNQKRDTTLFCVVSLFLCKLVWG